MLIGVQVCSPTTMLFFDVGVVGRLWRIQEKANIIDNCTFKRIKVVGTRDCKWHVDLDADGISQEDEWRLWAWDSRPLARL